MTCRDFKHNAAALSLVELAQTQDSQIVGHAESCPACAAWMDKQRSLAASLHALQSRTSSLEAGADVERALLRVFRQGIPASVGTSPSAAQVAVSSMNAMPVGMKEPCKAVRTIAAPVSTPIAWRLSRFFEVGAYVAVAAAVIIAMFLGVHLLHRGSGTAPMQGQSTPQKIAPAPQPPEVANAATTTAQEPRTLAHKQSPRVSSAPAQKNDPAVTQATNDDAQSVADAGYTALMLCDPLSCSGDTQVVRMELPPSPSAGAQPQVADVVVGYDGVVRAVRLEN